jgi:hypothetical protein
VKGACFGVLAKEGNACREQLVGGFVWSVCRAEVVKCLLVLAGERWFHFEIFELGLIFIFRRAQQPCIMQLWVTAFLFLYISFN